MAIAQGMHYLFVQHLLNASSTLLGLVIPCFVYPIVVHYGDVSMFSPSREYAALVIVLKQQCTAYHRYYAPETSSEELNLMICGEPFRCSSRACWIMVVTNTMLSPENGTKNSLVEANRPNPSWSALKNTFARPMIIILAKKRFLGDYSMSVIF